MMSKAGRRLSGKLTLLCTINIVQPESQQWLFGSATDVVPVSLWASHDLTRIFVSCKHFRRRPVTSASLRHVVERVDENNANAIARVLFPQRRRVLQSAIGDACCGVVVLHALSQRTGLPEGIMNEIVSYILPNGTGTRNSVWSVHSKLTLTTSKG
jgi:hypothetical protein